MHSAWPLCFLLLGADPRVTTRLWDLYPLDIKAVANRSLTRAMALPNVDTLVFAPTAVEYSRLFTLPLEYTASYADPLSLTLTYNGSCVAKTS